MVYAFPHPDQVRDVPPYTEGRGPAPNLLVETSLIANFNIANGTSGTVVHVPSGTSHT